MEALHNAAVECAEQLDREDIDFEEAMLFVHPAAYSAALKKTMQWVGVGEEDRILGMSITKTPKLPKGTVAVIHPEARYFGDKAIAFAQIESDD